MKAIVVHRYGGPEELRYEDFPDPSAGVGEVLVRVAAASINPVDALQRSGETDAFFPIVFPGVIGWDLAGTVIALGPGVDGFAVGDRVCGWAFQTYAELCAVKANLLAKVPDGVDLIEAAAVPLAGLTGSELILVGSGAKSGDQVLVSGATGAVGRAAVWAAKSVGARVIAGVSAKHVRDGEALGVDQVIALDDEVALSALPPVDVVANTVRGETAAKLLGKVKSGGAFASATGAPTNAAENPTVRVVDFVSKRDIPLLDRLLAAVAGGELVIPVGKQLPLREAADAHRLLAAGGAGKIVLLP